MAKATGLACTTSQGPPVHAQRAFLIPPPRTPLFPGISIK
jgi:hypothetical protein